MLSWPWQQCELGLCWETTGELYTGKQVPCEKDQVSGFVWMHYDVCKRPAVSPGSNLGKTGGDLNQKSIIASGVN